jgi:hypothetical protein
MFWLIFFYTLYILDKHIGMANIKNEYYTPLKSVAIFKHPVYAWDPDGH